MERGSSQKYIYITPYTRFKILTVNTCFKFASKLFSVAIARADSIHLHFDTSSIYRQCSRHGNRSTVAYVLSSLQSRLTEWSLSTSSGLRGQCYSTRPGICNFFPKKAEGEASARIPTFAFAEFRSPLRNRWHIASCRRRKPPLRWSGAQDGGINLYVIHLTAWTFTMRKWMVQIMHGPQAFAAMLYIDFYLTKIYPRNSIEWQRVFDEWEETISKSVLSYPLLKSISKLKKSAGNGCNLFHILPKRVCCFETMCSRTFCVHWFVGRSSECSLFESIQTNPSGNSHTCPSSSLEGQRLPVWRRADFLETRHC